MKPNLALTCTVLFLLSFAGCLPENPIGPITEDNLIHNPSFEFFGFPSMIGWNTNMQDTTLFRFYDETPPGGGKYSLGVEAVWMPENAVTAQVQAVTGVRRYRLSVWARSVAVGGSIALLLKSPDTLVFRKMIEVQEDVWTSYTLLDTISAKPGDSLFVSLSGGMSQLLSGRTLFDLCTLDILSGPSPKK